MPFGKLTEVSEQVRRAGLTPQPPLLKREGEFSNLKTAAISGSPFLSGKGAGGLGPHADAALEN